VPLISFQNPVDDPDEPTQLRPSRRSAPPVAWRYRERQHLRHRPRGSPTASGGWARATTRARSKGWSAARGATSWCRSHGQPSSRSSTLSYWSTAGAGWATGCVVMRRQSASGWCETRPPSCRCRRLHMKPARRRPPESSRCAWCATGAMTTRCRLPTATARILVRGYIHEVAIACGAEEICLSSAVLRAGGLRLRSTALSGAAGAEDRRARSGRSAGRLGLA
jgi:hypothetical protein